MTDADIGFLPATALLGRYHDRSLSPVEVTDAALRQIESARPWAAKRPPHPGEPS